METNTARSKHYLEKQGWKCWTVEQMVRIPPRLGMPAKMFKRDAFNFGDLLCFKPICLGVYATEKGIALVQTTSRSNQSERIKKIHEIPEAEGWLRSGGRIFVHGWAKRGPRGGRKVWEVQVTELGTEDEKKITAEEAPLFIGADDDF